MEYNDYMLRKRECISSVDSEHHKKLRLFILWCNYHKIDILDQNIDVKNLRFNNQNTKSNDK